MVKGLRLSCFEFNGIWRVFVEFRCWFSFMERKWCKLHKLTFLNLSTYLLSVFVITRTRLRVFFYKPDLIDLNILTFTLSFEIKCINTPQTLFYFPSTFTSLMKYAINLLCVKNQVSSFCFGIQRCSSISSN